MMNRFLLLALALFLCGCEAQLDWLNDRVLAPNTNTAVLRCVERNRDTGLGDAVYALCRDRHSVPVDGSAVGWSLSCDGEDRGTVTIRNDSPDVVVTGFRLRSENDLEATTIKGQWIPPRGFAGYALPVLCTAGVPPRAEVFSFLGVKVHLRPSLAPALGDPPVVVEVPVKGEPVVVDVGATEPETFTEQTRSTAGDAPGSEPLTDVAVPTLEDPIVSPMEAEQDAANEEVEQSADLPDEEVFSVDAPEPPVVPAKPTVTVARRQVQVSESDPAAYIPITLSSPTTAEGWINYRLFAGSAERNGDFIGRLDERLMLPVGTSSAAVVIPIVNDSLPEVREEFSIVLDFSSNNLSLPKAIEVGVEIRDDD